MWWSCHHCSIPTIIITLSTLLFIILPIFAGKNQICDENLFQCAGQDRCIQKEFICDGENDCLDGSDEKFCSTNTCENKFRCKNGKCIPKNFLCDSKNDCLNGEDENDDICLPKSPSCDFRCLYQTNQCVKKSALCDGIIDCNDGTDEAIQTCFKPSQTTQNLQCNANEFRCKDGSLCIPQHLHCDHNMDCPDSSDEIECVNTVHKCSSSNEFACMKGNQCVALNVVCDGKSDCADGSDEHATQCNKNQNNNNNSNSTTTTIKKCPYLTDFYCGPNEPVKCIDKTWVCDGYRDCVNGMDELHCNGRNCSRNEFKCHNANNCIFNVLVCDGHNDCVDKSDEENCHNKKKSAPTCDLTKEFDCGTSDGLCVPLSAVCNGRNDCGLNEDEKPDGKEENCYTKACEINNGNCSHYCADHHYKAICFCPTGYRLHSDQRTCIDINECNEMIAPCSHDCINTKGSYKCSCHQGYTPDYYNHSLCVAIGDRTLLYVAEGSIRQIEMQQHRMKSILEKAQLATVLDFSFDKNSNDLKDIHIFYSEVISGSINVVQMHGGETRTLFTQKDTVIEGLAFDWINNLLFWTDASEKAIFVMNVTSRDRHTLVKNQNLDRPRAIVVDPTNAKIYWTDWGVNAKIESMGMNGQDRQVIINQFISSPNGLAMDYETKRLFWTDSHLHLLSSYELATGKRHVILQNEKFYPYSVEVFEDTVYWSDWLLEEGIHSVNKFTGKNMKTIVRARKPMGIKMLHRMKQPQFHMQASSHCTNHECSHICLPAPQREGFQPAAYTCVCPDGLWKMSANGKTCKKDIQPPGGDNNGAAGGGDQSKEGNKESTEKPPRLSSSPSKENIGRISGITILLMSTLLLAICLIGYLYYRYKRTHVLRTVHFENPVYRKSNGSMTINNNNNNNIVIGGFNSSLGGAGSGGGVGGATTTTISSSVSAFVGDDDDDDGAAAALAHHQLVNNNNNKDHHFVAIMDDHNYITSSSSSQPPPSPSLLQAPPPPPLLLRPPSFSSSPHRQLGNKNSFMTLNENNNNNNENSNSNTEHLLKSEIVY